MSQEKILIKGAKEHNLKDINVEIPRNKLVVICGPSGSGKSTLAFNIIYAEGQRRYIEALSSYVRQFLPNLNKPNVEKIEGLTPSISIEQHTISHNPRSIVGTVTEIYDFLRILFANLGKSFCPDCNLPVKAQTVDEIVDNILSLPKDTKIILFAPIVEGRKGTFSDLLNKLKSQGFVRVRVDGEIRRIEEKIELEKNKKHNIDVVVDRLVIKEQIRKRLADSLELALSLSSGTAIVKRLDTEEELLFSVQSVCPKCKKSLPKPTPQLFSFNSPQGACSDCSGLGVKEEFDINLLIPDKNLSIEEGAIDSIFVNFHFLFLHRKKLEKALRRFRLSLKTPIKNFSEQALKILLYGSSKDDWIGLIPFIKSNPRIDEKRYMTIKPCPTCKGARLKKEALFVKINGVNIWEFCSWSVSKALSWLESLDFKGSEEKIASPILKELKSRLKFMIDVGLNYLTLNRNISTLSGGEAQRIRLAAQLGSGLVGITYVLDEPSIGLHPKDNKRLIESLKNLRDRGNTVIVVEHDENTIRQADYILELGPGSGKEGGYVVYQGNLSGLLEKKDSLTGKYLRKELTISKPKQRKEPIGFLKLFGVKTHNLKNINVEIPLGVFVCVTGVSGSGKSSLVVDTLYKHLLLLKGMRAENPGEVDHIEGVEQIDKVILIDQSPIGRTPRSNPATYTKVFDEIREIFASTPEAKKRGYKPGRFSFNVPGGRCEACQGDGQIKVEMHFLPDVYVNCEVCGGKRYNRETLDILYKGKNIAQILDMTVSEAREFFKHYPSLNRKLKILEDVGLGYLSLGQPATTLSGGEAQRLKISRELGKRSLPKTLYILDEPTTGLHMHEVGMLIKVLRKLVDKGATVVVIEHNLDVIKSADYIIDLGPGGGDYGGEIVACGTPEEIAKNPSSVTGTFLKD